MKEYIEREAAIDALTERNLVVHMDSVNDGLVASCHRSAQRVIANMPAADVRPVVYCRECIHWKKSELVICGNDDMVCDYHLGARYCRHADDFCSKGERREES